MALHLASEDAPTGVVMHSLSGRYLRSDIVANRGVSLGPDGDYEGLQKHMHQVMDLSEAKPLKEPGNIQLLGE